MHINIRINIPIRNKSRHATAFILRNGFQGRSRSDNDNWAKSGKWGQVYLYRECLDSIERLSREGSIDSLDLRLNWGPKCDVPIRTFWTKTEFLFLPAAKPSRSITRYSSSSSSLNHQKRAKKSKMCSHLASL